jgi:two-component system, NtrC family, response regulator GlrR
MVEAAKDRRTRPVSGPLRARMLKGEVQVTRGSDKGETASLDEGPLIVGGNQECGLRLTDPTVSARHCELSLRSGAVHLRDLGSTNGVFVDGHRVTEALLEIGTRIRLGQTELKLKGTGEEQVELSSSDQFAGLYGKSEAMRVLFPQLEAVAKSSAPLLIEGETGTGKDLAAEAVHRASGRAEGPFVVFDCGAAAPSLVEAELFGYEKGAFTGAVTSRPGLAESADGGTLVVDEVGELPLELQPKLLRLLEKKEVRHLGSNKPAQVDLRVVACTHRSLVAEVKSGQFRQDLYFRLSALRVRLPALRERTEDIPGLVDLMLKEQRSPMRFAELPESVQAMFLSHRWPGNVRELRNAVERLLAFPTLQAGLLDSEAPTASGPIADSFLPLSQARARNQDNFEQRYLRDLLRRSEGSVVDAARMAEISRQFLQKLLRKHGIR